MIEFNVFIPSGLSFNSPSTSNFSRFTRAKGIRNRNFLSKKRGRKRSGIRGRIWLGREKKGGESIVRFGTVRSICLLHPVVGFHVAVLIFEQRSRKLCRLSLGTSFRGRVQPTVKGISLYTDVVVRTDGWHSL